MFLEPRHASTRDLDSPAEEETPEQLRQRYRRKRRTVRTGQIIMLVGALVGVYHLVSHFGVFGPVPPLEMVIGYPIAGAIFLTGAILGGRK